MQKTEEQISAQPSDELVGTPSKDLRSLIAILRRWWIALASAVVGCMGLAIAAAFFMQPIYEVQVTMTEAEQPQASGGLSSLLSQYGGLASLAGLSLGKDSNVTTAVVLLQSRQFGEAFIEQKKLLPVFFADKYDAKSGKWTVPPEKVPTLWDGYKFFDREIRRVYVDNKVGMILLQVTWHDKEQAAEWANELVRVVNADMRNRAITESTKSIKHLEGELERTKLVSLQQALNGVLELEIRRRALANAREEYVFRVLDPAAAPGPKDFVRPKRALYIVLSPFIGLLFGIGLVALLEFGSHVRRAVRVA